MAMEKLPEKLVQARKKMGLTQEELGEKVGLSRRSINAYENGTTRPYMRTLERLAEALNVKSEYLYIDELTIPNMDDYTAEKIAAMRERYGHKVAGEFAEYLNGGLKTMAGGKLSPENTELFLDVLENAFEACMKAAQEKFTPKSRRKQTKT